MPLASDATLLARISRIETSIAQLSTVLPMNPLSVAPSSPSKGWVAHSDGTSSILSFGDAGEGLYRYTGSAWVRVG